MYYYNYDYYGDNSTDPDHPLRVTLDPPRGPVSGGTNVTLTGLPSDILEAVSFVMIRLQEYPFTVRR